MSGSITVDPDRSSKPYSFENRVINHGYSIRIRLEQQNLVDLSKSLSFVKGWVAQMYTESDYGYAGFQLIKLGTSSESCFIEIELEFLEKAYWLNRQKLHSYPNDKLLSRSDTREGAIDVSHTP